MGYYCLRPVVLFEGMLHWQTKYLNSDGRNYNAYEFEIKKRLNVDYTMHNKSLCNEKYPYRKPLRLRNYSYQESEL